MWLPPHTHLLLHLSLPPHRLLLDSGHQMLSVPMPCHVLLCVRWARTPPRALVPDFLPRSFLDRAVAGMPATMAEDYLLPFSSEKAPHHHELAVASTVVERACSL
jgi:3'(2'), 5'-bisphosphate nucleotidase